jgi:hypothetical protein
MGNENSPQKQLHLVFDGVMNVKLPVEKEGIVMLR